MYSSKLLGITGAVLVSLSVSVGVGLLMLGLFDGVGLLEGLFDFDGLFSGADVDWVGVAEPEPDGFRARNHQLPTPSVATRTATSAMISHCVLLLLGGVGGCP